MAKVIRQHLGVARGKVGDVVFKRRKGKSYVATAPIPYKKTTSKKLIKNRGRFAAVSKFASGVTDSPYRFRIWKKPNLKGKTSYKKCFCYNYVYTKGNMTWRLTRITPGDLYLSEINVVLTPDTLEMNFRISEEVFNILKEDFIVSTVIFMREPINGESEVMRYNSYITIDEEVRDFNPSLTEINHFRHKFDKPGKLAITDKYKNVMVYTTFISKKEEKGKQIFTAGEAFAVRGFEADEKELAVANTAVTDDGGENKPFYRFRAK